SKRHVLSTNGRRHVERRFERLAGSRQTLAATGGQMAMARDKDSSVRAGGALSDGDQLFCRNTRRDEIGGGRRARRGQAMDVLDAAHSGQIELADRRPALA